MNNTPFSVFAARGNLPLNQLKREKDVYDMPFDEIAGMASRMCIMLALAWDYTDTIKQIARTLRLDVTKRIGRQIDELRRVYEQRFSNSLRDKESEVNKAVALLFEDVCQEHFRKLHWSLRNEIKQAFPDLRDNYVDLLEAVDTAITVFEAARLFTEECDAKLRAQGVNGNPMLPPEIRKTMRLLPLFAGDSYNFRSRARAITARILMNEIKLNSLVDERGKEF